MIYMGHWHSFKAVSPLKVASPSRGPFKFVFPPACPWKLTETRAFPSVFASLLGEICIILMSEAGVVLTDLPGWTAGRREAQTAKRQRPGEDRPEGKHSKCRLPPSAPRVDRLGPEPRSIDGRFQYPSQGVEGRKCLHIMDNGCLPIRLGKRVAAPFSAACFFPCVRKVDNMEQQPPDPIGQEVN